MIARLIPVIVPADAVMFPDVLIVPPALKVVPALMEPRDEMFPSDAMFPPAFIVDCVVIAPLSPNIVHFAGEIAGSPTFNPPLHLTVPSK